MRMSRAVIFTALYLLAGGGAAQTQDVTLTSWDRNVEISGTLLGYDGEFYRLDTIYGELTVDGSGVLCDGPGCPNLQDFVAEVTLSGSSTMGSVLLPALLQSFAQRERYKAEREESDSGHFDFVLSETQTNKRVGVFRFRATNSDEGFADLLANEADLVMSIREIREDERNRALEVGIGDLTVPNRSRVLALDAIVPIVQPENPVLDIIPQSLARVFAGKIKNWSLLGGVDAEISLHALSEKTGLGQASISQILAPLGLVIADNVVFHETSATLIQAVLNDPFAIGIASFAEVGTAKPLVLKGSCGRQMRATRWSIKTEDYPLTAPMFLYKPSRRLPKIARDFLAFVQSPAAQIVIRRSGFVDQAPEQIPINQQGDRFSNAISSAGPEISLTDLQRMVELLGPMKRLTTSFRFEAGSARLDAQSRSNVVQLADDIEKGRYDAQQVYFVGYSDGNGPAERNRQIALERANAARDAVVAAAETADLSLVDMKVDAFGEAMPLACDDSAWGRQVNRRVEVWMR